MRLLFVGMFIIALLAGVTAKYVDRPGQTSWLGHIMISLGLKKHKEEADQVANSMVSNSSKMKDKFDENLGDQQLYLSTTRDQIMTLSQLIEDKMNRDSSLDLLHLKELVKQSSDQSNLLIENGKKLMALHDEQLRLNRQLVQKANIEAIISDSDRNRFVQNIKDNISHQQDMIKAQEKEDQELRDRMQQIHEQIQQMHDNVSSKEDPEFLDKLKSISEKSQSTFENVKQRQEQLFNMNQNNLNNINSVKERINDLKQQASDSINRNRQNSDLGDSNIDRIKDQIQSLKDKRMK